jgi:hypothetical protein
MSISIKAVFEDSTIDAEYNYKSNDFDLTIKNTFDNKTLTLNNVSTRSLAASMALAIDKDALEDLEQLNAQLYDLAKPLTDSIEDYSLRIIP